MSEKRRALRDFYKLQNEAASEVASVSGGILGSELGSEVASEVASEDGSRPTTPSIPLEEETEEETTEITELDNEDLDVDEFVRKLINEEPLTAFVATAEQIRREEAMLASSQRELVNDNYKKLIQAAETLGYLSAQGDLAGVHSLVQPVDRLAQWTQRMR